MSNMKINSHIHLALDSLKKSPLKVTKQRVDIIKILFKDGNNHFTAEDVHKKIEKLGLNISLATVYNCLNQFTENNIIKAVKTSCNKIYFDTNTTSHYHFYCKNSSNLIDIESRKIKISKLPKIPSGKKLDSIDIIVNLSDWYW